MIDEEIAKLQREAPTARELERSLNQIEASFYNRMERVGGFGGKADQLNAYYTDTGDPDWFNEDLARYRALSPSRHQRRRGAVPAARPPRRADRRCRRRSRETDHRQPGRDREHLEDRYGKRYSMRALRSHARC